MTDRERLVAVLSALQAALRDLERYARDVPYNRLVSDGDAARMVKQALQEGIQASIDVAQILLSGAGISAPDTYQQVFVDLQHHLKLDRQLAERLAAAAGLRNLLVHIYTELDLQRIYQAYTQDRGDLAAFAAWVAARMA